MSRVPYIEQMEHSECGLACLAMILGYYKHRETLAELRNKFDPPREGISFFHLIKIAEFYNLKGKAYQIKDFGLEQINAQNFPLPFIAHWDGGKHFVVVEKISKSSVFILDPSFGKSKISKKEFYELFTGSLLYFSVSSNFREKRKSSRVNFFTSFIFEQKKWIISLFFVSVLLQALGIVIPFLIKHITDNLVSINRMFEPNILGFFIASIFIVFIAFSLLRGFLITKLQKNMDFSLMSRFIKHMFRLPYLFFEKRTSGDLLYRANSHVLIRQLLSVNLIAFIIDSVLIITYAAILLFLSFELGTLVLALGGAIFMVLVITTPITLRLTKRDVITQSKVQSFLTENINSITDIKAMGFEERLFSHWNKKFTEHLDVVEKNNHWDNLLGSFASGIQFVMPLLLLWMGSYSILRNEMTLGEVLAFSTLAAMFITPLLSVGTNYIELIQLSSIFQRLFDVFDSKTEDHTETTHTKKIIGKIKFTDVSFKFDSFGDDILKDINLEINPGEKVGIVGVSGSGKSTLVKLIIGLYKHTNGEILIDDIPIEKYDLKKLRRQIGVVLQETNLFHKTILENIAIQDENPNMERVFWAAKSSEIHKDILDLPLKYNTMLSETGVNFSGGQRQRLLLARALYNTPPILILDEATSNLDSIHEKAIDNNVSEYKSTRIIIAHRLSTIKDADKIVVLNRGEISEFGTHDELMQKKDLYYELYKSQTEGERMLSY